MNRAILSCLIGLSVSGCGGANPPDAKPAPAVEASPPPPAATSSASAPVAAASEAPPKAAPPPPKGAVPPEDSATVYVVVAQGSKLLPVRDGGTVTIAKEPFAFRFPVGLNPKGKPYGASIAGDKADRLLRLKDRVPASATDNPSGLSTFGGGSTFASSAGGLYKTFVLSDEGSHYINYDPDSSISRSTLVKELGNGRREVEFTVTEFYDQNKHIPVTAAPYRKLYFAVFIDVNDDGIIDPGELVRFTVELGAR